MSHQGTQLKLIVQTALFAAFSYIMALFQFRIPAPVGHPFVDLGFTFVALGGLLLGWKYGTLAGVIGLGLFDITQGYANHAYLTVLEVVVLVAVVSLLARALRHVAMVPAIITIGITAGLTKAVTGYFRYVVESLVDFGLSLSRALQQAFVSFPADVITGILMMIALPIIYIALHPLLKRSGLSSTIK
ncbi:ECF transporter S component [Agrilactobacillus fermenti]|uniref:ECF transporter S component n=1 Tax=Agrilactobacillus fermenti TaxID=2586909 RepID=UPI001E2ED43D|nr:ECF transporter S component [Agrilactobacillus fermenti]MCD2256270.1 ECF transporter S component [Agrilactobacillus fermenti]